MIRIPKPRRPLRGQRYLFKAGVCERCGRRLKSKRSVERGFGRTCYRVQCADLQNEGVDEEQERIENAGV